MLYLENYYKFSNLVFCFYNNIIYDIIYIILGPNLIKGTLFYNHEQHLNSLYICK